jgi:hypothetical protein
VSEPPSAWPAPSRAARAAARPTRRWVWPVAILAGLVPVAVYPGILGVWPGLLATAVLVGGALLAWWRPDLRLAGGVVATLGALGLYFFGQSAAAFESACLFGECPPPSVTRTVGIKAAAMAMGAAVVPGAGWFTARSAAGRWAWGSLTVLVLVWGALSSLGFSGVFD